MLRTRLHPLLGILGLMDVVAACRGDSNDIPNDDTTSDATPETTSTSGTAMTLDSASGESSETLDAGTTSVNNDSSSGVRTTEGPNQAPAAQQDVYVMADVVSPLAIDAMSGVLANDDDPDGDPLTVAFDAVGSAGGTVIGDADGSFTYTRDTAFWGEDVFGYLVDDGHGGSSMGTVRIVSPPTVPLATVAGGFGGFAIDGEQEGDGSGRSVSRAGDVNGDGLADVIVAADRGVARATYAAWSYVVFGKADRDAVLLSEVTMGAGGFALEGEAAFSGFAFSGALVSGAGDIDGDGLGDIVVAAPAVPHGSGVGRAYAIFGKTDSDSVALSDVALGIGGFAIENETGNYDAHLAVSGAGDINGDGFADILVGAPSMASYAGGGAWTGRTYVVFGKADGDGVSLDQVAAGAGGFAVDGAAQNDRSGFSVGGAGDVDGDGLADLIIGAPYADPHGSYSGRSYVVFGKADGATVLLAEVEMGVGGFSLDGEAADDRSGSSVSGAGDVNGDGLDDVIIGAHQANPSGTWSGRSYVVFGKADGDAVSLADVVTGDGGFSLDGEAYAAHSGYSVGGAGDVDGDGLDDLVVGAHATSPNDEYWAGRTYVVFGKSDGDTVLLSDVSMGDGGFALDGEAPYDFSGKSVCGAGDVDGDGFADVIIGSAYHDSPLSDDRVGRSYVIFGGDFAGAF